MGLEFRVSRHGEQGCYGGRSLLKVPFKLRPWPTACCWALKMFERASRGVIQFGAHGVKSLGFRDHDQEFMVWGC